jgi:hypothetical protein
MEAGMRGLFAVRKASGGDQEFWDWIRQHLPAPNSTTEALIRFVDAANHQLNDIAPGLIVEAGSIGDELCIVISADGIRHHFPAVESLVAAAGSLPGWQVKAFRQPRKPSEIEYGGKTFGPSDVWFENYDIDGELGLNLYVTGFDPSSPSIEGGAAFVFLDMVLGEYNVATMIGPIDFFALPSDPAAQGLRPIAELHEVVTAMSAGPLD